MCVPFYTCVCNRYKLVEWYYVQQCIIRYFVDILSRKESQRHLCFAEGHLQEYILTLLCTFQVSLRFPIITNKWMFTSLCCAITLQYLSMALIFHFNGFFITFSFFLNSYLYSSSLTCPSPHLRTSCYLVDNLNQSSMKTTADFTCVSESNDYLLYGWMQLVLTFCESSRNQNDFLNSQSTCNNYKSYSFCHQNTFFEHRWNELSPLLPYSSS